MTLIYQLTIIDDTAALDEFLTNLVKPSKPTTIAFINAHGLNMCYKNSEFLDHLLGCDYVFRDGIGIKILLGLLGRPSGLNLNGTDLIPKILQKSKGQTIALFGTKAPYLNQAATVIEDMGLDVKRTLDGFQSDDKYHGGDVDICLLAMGMPKQERVATHLSQSFNRPALIICGGAILDFMSGKVSRAPEIFRKYGMEWAYRLLQEPKRLCKRYVIGNFVMLGHASRLKLKSKSFAK